MEGALKWCSWLIILGWSSDLFMSMYLGNSTQSQSSGIFQTPCGSCWQCEMKVLPSDRETRIDHVQSSGDCSLGLPSVDLDLSKKGGADGVLLESGKMKVGTVFGFPTQLCQSQSLLKSKFPVTFQQSSTLFECQILCLPDSSLNVGRTTAFPSIWYLRKDSFPAPSMMIPGF